MLQLKITMILKYLLLLQILPASINIFFGKNNVCDRFLDYHFPSHNENCYYDPDTTLTEAEIIRKYAGKVEIHETKTEDGYILNMLRIPHKSPKAAILFHHSIATHSRIFLYGGNASIALRLWAEGYDIWLANHRGTTWSAKHVSLSTFHYKFWDFSVHELGFYDVDSEVDYIKRLNGQQELIFFGHSLGSAAGLVYASLRPKKAQENLKTMVLLAAPTYRQEEFSLQQYEGLLRSFTGAFHIGSPFFVTLPVLKYTSRVFLRAFPVFLYVTALAVNFVCGETTEELNPAFYNYDIGMFLGDFSFKTLYHFVQMFEKDRFDLYEYSSEENLKRYGQKTAPSYPIEQISVPVLIVSSYNDTLIPLQSSEKLYAELPLKSKPYGHWKLTGLNHLDYHIGKNRHKKFINDLITFLNENR